MKPFLSILAIIFLTASCVKEENTNFPNGTPKEENYPDVSYGADAKQKIDIYLPAGRSTDSTKTIVIIHGGGWTGGDKKDMVLIADSMKKRLKKYAIVNINYRLAANNTTNLFPSQENDVKAAIEFYLGKSSGYKVSKDLVLAGASAGGHLVLLHSYKNDLDKHVKAVIDYFGPTELYSLWNAGILQQLALFGAVGKSYDQDPTIYFQSSPVNFITPQSPPTIVIQGELDPLVPASQSALLINKLTEKSVINQLVSYPNGGHGDWPIETYSDSFKKIQEFIEANVK